MGDLELVINLGLAVLAAFVGGTIAQRLGQPVLLGYLAGGVVIGPFSPGPTADVHYVQLMAEVGVAFLMFALGAEVSMKELRELGRAAPLAGLAEVIFLVLLGPVIAPAVGLSFTQGIFLGAILSLSSTVVALKLLMGRGELQSLHGRVTLGILLVQDIAVVPMVVVLPSLASGGGDIAGNLLLAALKAGAVLAGTYVVGSRLVPRLLQGAAIPRSRELFILSVVALALGTSLVTAYAGLSMAFGAFLAGLVVSESEYRTQVVAEVIPLRDLFASLFFVSVGMLINPTEILSQAGLVTLLLVITLVGKTVVVALLVLLLGMPGKVALLAGLNIAQVGEFSFVLASLGVSSGALPVEVFSLTLATALGSILLAPFLPMAAPGLLGLLQKLPLVGTFFLDPKEGDPVAGGLRGHTVICGFGGVGRELADALERRNLKFLVVEYNPEVVRDIRAQGIPVVYGDAGNPVVLAHAHLERATMLAVLVPDSHTCELATRHARALYPRLDIVARAYDASQVRHLQEAGATEVVQPEFEAGVEVIRHCMSRYGIGGPELGHLVAGRRRSFYRRASQEAE